MSKLLADSRHPEWHQAMLALVRELDVPDRLYMPIRDLVGPGLGRVFFREWLKQDAIDPEIMFSPFDLAGGAEDPAWFQIDGNPALGGSAEDVMRRKWERRASIWVQFFGPHVWHVIDWLIVAREADQSWLYNLDERGEPKKLRKCHTLDSLVQEANKGLRHRTGGEIGLGPDDERFVTDLGVGHALVELRSPRALRHEGNRMRHCVGKGSYDGHLDDPAFRLLSVRDPDGKPLGTLEIHHDVVRQFRGLDNADPATAVVDLVVGAAHDLGWSGVEEAARGRYRGVFDGRALRMVAIGGRPIR